METPWGQEVYHNSIFYMLAQYFVLQLFNNKDPHIYIAHAYKQMNKVNI
jgi:hypothetical protein